MDKFRRTLQRGTPALMSSYRSFQKEPFLGGGTHRSQPGKKQRGEETQAHKSFKQHSAFGKLLVIGDGEQG